MPVGARPRKRPAASAPRSPANTGAEQSALVLASLSRLHLDCVRTLESTAGGGVSEAGRAAAARLAVVATGLRGLIAAAAASPLPSSETAAAPAVSDTAMEDASPSTKKGGSERTRRRRLLRKAKRLAVKKAATARVRAAGPDKSRGGDRGVAKPQPPVAVARLKKWPLIRNIIHFYIFLHSHFSLILMQACSSACVVICLKLGVLKTQCSMLNFKTHESSRQTLEIL